MMTLDEFLRFNGFEEALGLPLDGQFHRFGRNGGASNGWFKGLVTPSGLKVASFGDWKTSERHEWTGDTLENPAKAARALEELRLIELEEHDRRTARQEEVSKECQQIAGIRSGTQLSPYFERKGLSPEAGRYGCWVESESDAAKKFGPQTMVPAYDIDGKLWGIQRRGSDGYRSFKEGMRIKGCHVRVGWHLLEAKEIKRVFLAEGISTAASIFEAFSGSEFVISCFSAGNLKSVAEAVRKQWPAADIIICADNDWETEEKTGENPGIKAAWNAIVKNGQEYVVWPENLEPGESDYNDAHQRLGLPWVKESILKGMGSGAGVPAPVPTEPAELPEPKKKAPPTNQAIANRLLAIHTGVIVKQEHDLFVYTGKAWQHLKKADTDTLKQRLQFFCGGKAKASQIEDIFKLFVQACPHVPSGVDLYAPPAWLVNFQNGTLHITKHAGEYKHYFREHSKADWAINILPYDYKDDWSEKNPEFEAMLDRIFDGDADKGGKITALAQMFGAALCPAFPHLFMLHGKPGTGKSTAIILAAKLAHPDNCCSVDPTEWSGFDMETMAGKLVNYDTDIEVAKPITDKMVKKVIDRVPMRVKRKNIKDIYVPLPATHMFGGNDIPKTLDGRSGAMTRRWTFIGFDAVVAKGDYDVSYIDHVWSQGYRGVLNFALKGLADLLVRRGHFFQPDSGKKKMEEWNRSTDVVGQFVKACEEGEIKDETNQVKVEKEALIKRPNVWACFKNWHQEEFSKVSWLGRNAFFDRLRDHGFEDYRTKTERYFKGLGISEKADGVM